jgi:hypothetical protein
MQKPPMPNMLHVEPGHEEPEQEPEHEEPEQVELYLPASHVASCRGTWVAEFV